MQKADLLAASDAALAGDWHRAHRIVQQDEHDPDAYWLHAVLHKIEGEAINSRYWYARTAHRYEDRTNAQAELRAIRAEIEAGNG